MPASATETMPQANVPEYQYNTDILRRFRVGEASSQVNHEDSIVQNRDAGVYGIGDAFGGKESDPRASKLIVDAVSAYLASNQFDPADPAGSMNEAFEAAQDQYIDAIRQQGIAPDKSVSASFLKFYENEDGILNAVTGQIGHTVMYGRKGADGETGALLPRDLNSEGKITACFSANEDLFQVQQPQIIENIEPGDRFIIMSAGTAGTAQNELLSFQQIKDAGSRRNTRSAARALLAAQTINTDKSALVIEVPRQRRSIKAAFLEGLNRPREAGATDINSGEAESQTFWQRTRNRGATVLRAPGVFFENKRKTRGSTAVDSTHESWASRNKAPLRGLGAAALAGLGIWAVAAGAHYLKVRGMDVVPSDTALWGLWPDKLGDNDGVDYLPVNGKTELHSVSVSGNLANGSPDPDGGLFDGGWFADDDPAPTTDVETKVNVDNLNLSGLDNLDYSPEPDVTPIEPTADQAPAVVPDIEPAQVPDGGSVTGMLHDAGHIVRGEEFDDNDAWAAYLQLEPSLDLHAIQPVGTDDAGLFPMADGHMGVVDDGMFEMREDIERKAVRILQELDLAAQ